MLQPFNIVICHSFTEGISVEARDYTVIEHSVTSW